MKLLKEDKAVNYRGFIIEPMEFTGIKYGDKTYGNATAYVITMEDGTPIDGKFLGRLMKDAEMKTIDTVDKGKQIVDRIVAEQDGDLIDEDFGAKSTIQRTVRNALQAVPRYIQKYGDGSAFEELKYRFNLLDYELVWVLNKSFEKGYIDAGIYNHQIEYLRLQDEDGVEHRDEYADYDFGYDDKDLWK